MTENICLMLTESDTTNAFVRVLNLAAAAVDLRQRTVLYLAGRWADYAQAGHFQQGGGQIWVSAFNASNWDLNKHPLAAGATVVDDRTLLNIITQGTAVLNI